MKIESKTLEIDNRLWVQYGGVEIEEKKGRLLLTGKDEDSFLKVFNHFGRVLKLYTFEDGRWLDADTGLPAQPFDEAQAGHLPKASPVAGKKPAAAKGAARGSAAKPKTKAAPAGKSRKAAGATTGGKTRSAKSSSGAKSGRGARAGKGGAA